MDIVTGEHRGPKRLIIWENTGRGEFTPHVVDRGRENHLGARAADMDGDGDLDLVGICWDSYWEMHLWRNDAIKYCGTRASGRPRRAPTAPRAFAPAVSRRRRGRPRTASSSAYRRLDD